MEEQIMEEVVETEEVQTVPVERDYGSEVEALYEARPELRGELLPDEVLQACVRGRSSPMPTAGLQRPVRKRRKACGRKTAFCGKMQNPQPRLRSGV